MKSEYGSIHHEPTFQGGRHAPDPSEARTGPTDQREKVDNLRDSVTQEPHLVGTEGDGLFREWLDQRKTETTWFSNLWTTLLAGVVGGPFALIGAMFSGQQGAYGVLYIVLIGPIIEELLKQSGMIYLVERKPYRVSASWQFFLAACISAIIFASVENMMYVARYSVAIEDPVRFAAFRWKVCTVLHVCCAMIAALGVRRVWRKQVESGQPADLSHGFPFIITAITVHGVYNTCAMVLSDNF